MTVNFQGHVFTNAGVAVSGATIDIFTVATGADESTASGSATASTTTDSTGLWTSSGVAEGLYDVRITNGTEFRWLRYEDRVQLDTIEMANLSLRNPGDTFTYDITPGAISASRTLNLPVITATDTVAVLGLAQTFTADQTFNDNVNLTFGTGGDVDLDYDGTDLVLNLTVVGSGDFVVNGGSIELDDSEGVTFGTGKDATVQYDGTDLIISPAAVGTGDVHISGGSIELDDSEGVTFGTGKDATIAYDGTNLVVEPRAVGSGNLVVNDTCIVAVNDTTHGVMTTGFLANQGTATNIIAAFKSSNINHGLTSGVFGNDVETDDFLTFEQSNGDAGGIKIQALNEDSVQTRVFQLHAWGGTADATKSTGAAGLFDFFATEHDGANALADVAADGNIVAFRCRRGGSNVAVFIFDEDGDSHQDVGTAWTNFDDFDDFAVMDAYATTLSHPGDPILERFVNDLESHRELIESLPGKPVVTFNDDGHHFLNSKRMMMVHHGAIRQAGDRIQALEKQLEETQRLLAGR